MRKALLALVMCGFLLGADPQKEAKQVKRKVWAGISVNQPVFGNDSPRRVLIDIALVNDSDKTMDVERDLDSSQLIVNGKEWKDWDVTIANGPRDDRIRALAPGEDISIRFDLHDLFKSPGIYKVTWKGKAFEAKEIEFRVLPKKHDF
jgi:hypothetical protein